jgi:molybdopterin synthase catalytic subunit
MIEPGIYEKEHLDISSLIKNVLEEKQPEDVGALVTFLGITKRSGQDGKEVARIEMESYEEHASKTIQKICREVEKKFGATSVKIYHMVGKFNVGDPLVFVMVTSRSRSQAIPALDEAIHRFKTEPALWKKEVYIDGTSQWISHA